MPEHIVRFGDFELALRSGELRKAGVRIALPEQSLRVLVHLLERPGDLVTREELREQLWAADTFVDFEHGLNTAVRRLRDALGDSAETPRFVETLPRRGYRFIAPVHPPADGAGRAPGARPSWLTRLPAGVTLAILCAAAAAGAAAMVWLRAERTLSPAQSTRLLASVHPADQLLSAQQVDRSPRLGFGRPSRTAIALSPDDRLLVFSGPAGGVQQLYLRPLDRSDARPITGTEGGDSPFFSPDGRWIGFWADGRIKRVPVSGGRVITVCDAAPLVGSSWGSDDTIVFALRTGGLWQVPAAGGPAAPLTTLAKGELSHRLPHVLPGAHAVLFTVQTRRPGWDDATIEVYVRATAERRRLLEGGADARYVSTGHLLYGREGAAFAVAFDPVRLQVSGAPVAVLDDVMQAVGSVNTGATQLSVDRSGTLAYVPGGIYPDAQDTLVWVNRSGRAEPLGAPARRYHAPRLSPDGRQLAVGVGGRSGGFDVWTYDLTRGTLTPLTFDGSSGFPVWTPDGRRLAFASAAIDGRRNLYWIAADGSGQPERLTTSDHEQDPADWSLDRSVLVFVERDPKSQGDIWALSMKDGLKVTRIVGSPFDEIEPALSPDGRWLAYASDESGRYEVYVQPYPGVGAKHQLSPHGGREPLWSRDGREVFTAPPTPAPGEPLMRVPVRIGSSFAAERSTPLFDMWPYLTAGRIRGYEIAGDGRFLMVRSQKTEPTRVTHVQIVLNWFEELKRKVPPVP